MITDVLGQILALGGLIVISLIIKRFLRLELSLSCLLTGFLAGITLQFIDFDTGIRAHNLKDLVFFLVLPVLIFEAAWAIQPKLLKQWLIPVMLLAIPGVLIGASIMAALIYYGIGHPSGFPWIAAFLAGTILAATDPIAVINQLHEMKAPDGLTTLFEGESLFNDASVIVLFAIVIGVATGEMQHEQNPFMLFIRVFFGGALFGLVCGLITSAIIVLISSSSASRLLLLLSAFSSFYLAEHHLHVSGIMAVTLCALTTRIFLRRFEETLAAGIAETWEWLGLFFNALLFIVMGLVITPEMFTHQWLAILIAIVAAFIARTLSVAVCGVTTILLPRPVPYAWQCLLVWGGLRGAIAIALVLSLPISLPYWWTIQSMVFGVVIFGMLIQGSTNKSLANTLLKAHKNKFD